MSYTCNRHGTPDLTSWCPRCLNEFDARRPAASMTVDEKASELLIMDDQVTIPFASIQLRIGELMGRGVFTHELTDFDSLVAELRSGQPADIDTIVGKLL